MTDWPVKTLGDICRIEMGRTPPRGDSKGWDKAFKTTNHWASIADLTACNGKVLTSTKERISDFAAKTTKVVPAGTLMMSFKLSIGKLAFAGCDLYTNEAIAAFHLHEPSVIDSDFLYWALSVVDWSALTKGSEKVKGATMNKAKLNLLEIPVPPLDEQKRIVKLLDDATARVTELTACYEQARTHTNNLFACALRDALEGSPDWPVRTLGEICELQRGHDLPTPERRDGNVPILGATGVTGYHDVARYGGPGVAIGRSGFIGGAQYCDSPYWPLNTCLFVKDFFGNDPKWVYYFLKSIDFSQYNSGTTQPSLNRNNLSGITVRSSSPSDQRETVVRLDSMRAKTSEMVAAYDAKLTAAKNLRQSILEAAFAGEL